MGKDDVPVELESAMEISFADYDPRSASSASFLRA